MTIVPVSCCKVELADLSALWFDSRYMRRNSWFYHEWSFCFALFCNHCSLGALESKAPCIWQIIRLKPPHMIHPLVWLSNRSNPRNRPRYSATSSVNSIDSHTDATIVHSGSNHTIALYAQPFRFTRADPLNLVTNRWSPSSTVCSSIILTSLGCQFEQIAISISSTLYLGVMLSARIPSILSFPLSHLLTSKV